MKFENIHVYDSFVRKYVFYLFDLINFFTSNI